jgi:hypothetical protein
MHATKARYRLNPNKPSNVAFLTWVTLINLPFEHHDQAIDIKTILDSH